MRDYVRSDRLSQTQLDLHLAFAALDAALMDFAAAARRYAPLVSLLEPANDEPPLHTALAAFQRLDFLDDDAATEDTLICGGALNADADMLAAAERVNACKDAVIAVLAGVRTAKAGFRSSPDAAIEYEPMGRACLRLIGRARTSHRMLRRHWPILPARPEAIGFTWAHTRPTYRESRDEVLNRLVGVDGQDAAQDRERLLMLDESEVLAVLGARQTNLRANLRWPAAGPWRAQVEATLPLLVPAVDPMEPLPITGKGRAGRDSEPRERSSAKLETTPFLHSLAVYRYRGRA